MAEKLDGFDWAEAEAESRRRKAGPLKYPYDTWFDGRIWLLTRGEDFDISTESVVKSLWNYAGSHGLGRVKSVIVSDTQVAIQLVPKS